MSYLSEEFLSKYPDKPECMDDRVLQVFDKKYNARNLTWKENTVCLVNGSIGLSEDRFEENEYCVPHDKLREEAEVLFDNIFNMRQFLPECSFDVEEEIDFDNLFVDVRSILDIKNDTLYKITQGHNVSVRCTRDNAKNLKPIRTNVKTTHKICEDKGNRKYNELRLVISNGKSDLKIAIKVLFETLTSKHYEKVEELNFVYSTDESTFTTISTLLKGIENVLKGTFDDTIEPSNITDTTRQLRPIHIYDLIGLANLKESCVTFTCDEGDLEVINAKANLTPKLENRLSVNTFVEFEEKPTMKQLEILKDNNVFGIVNPIATRKRRPNGVGVSSFGEVILDSHGTCNMTYVDVLKLVRVKEDIPILDYQGLMQAQALSARAGLRETCALSNQIDERDRIIACSLVNFKQAVKLLKYDEDQSANILTFLADVAYRETIKYAHILRVPTPLLTTTITPVIKGYTLSEENYPNNLVEQTDDFENTAEDCFNEYFFMQENYSSHNTSTPIFVKPHEWEDVKKTIIEKWDDIVCLTLIMEEATEEGEVVD